jgi:hypothetical protein
LIETSRKIRKHIEKRNRRLLTIQQVGKIPNHCLILRLVVISGFRNIYPDRSYFAGVYQMGEV